MRDRQIHYAERKFEYKVYLVGYEREREEKGEKVAVRQGGGRKAAATSLEKGQAEREQAVRKLRA